MPHSGRSMGHCIHVIAGAHRIQPLAVPVILWLVLSAPSVSQEVTPASTVDVGTFTIEAPAGDDWDVTVEKQKGYAEFSRGKQKLLSIFTSGAGGGTVLKVFRDRPVEGAPGIWLMNEAEMADYYRDNEMKISRELGRRVGFTTTDVQKDTVRIDGVKYYTLSYMDRKKSVAIESILYLYLPPGFVKSREVYGFLISESYREGSIFASKDLDQIRPVMNSLRIKDPLKEIAGLEGEFLRASAAGDSMKVSELVRQGVNVNAAPAGKSALVLAAMMGHAGLVPFLTERGAVLNPGGDSEGAWPLTAAILGRELDIARSLVEKGAQVNVRSNKGWTPLMRAIGVHADTAFLSSLLRRGAGVNDRNEAGWTPLMMASYENLPGAVSLLFESGADPNLRAGNGWTAMMLAAQHNAVAAGQVLLTHGADPDIAAESGWTAALFASAEGNLEILEMVAAKGANLRAKSKVGVNALDIAAYNGHPECLRFLLGRGLDINDADDDGWTPLMYAATKGDTVAVRALIDGGADLNRKNKKDETALEMADDRDHDAVVEMLEKAGAED